MYRAFNSVGTNSVNLNQVSASSNDQNNVSSLLDLLNIGSNLSQKKTSLFSDVSHQDIQTITLPASEPTQV